MKGKVKYWMPEHGETGEEDATEIDVSDVDDLELCAEEAAEFFHDNCDGWECSWPNLFTVWNGSAVGTFEVDREYSPTFYARRRRCRGNCGTEVRSVDWLCDECRECAELFVDG